MPPKRPTESDDVERPAKRRKSGAKVASIGPVRNPPCLPCGKKQARSADPSAHTCHEATGSGIKRCFECTQVKPSSGCAELNTEVSTSYDEWCASAEKAKQPDASDADRDKVVTTNKALTRAIGKQYSTIKKQKKTRKLAKEANRDSTATQTEAATKATKSTNQSESSDDENSEREAEVEDLGLGTAIMTRAEARLLGNLFSVLSSTFAAIARRSS